MMQVGPYPIPAWRWMVLLLLVWGLGCSAETKLNPVEGKVLVNKKPAAGVLVAFHPKGADPIKTIRPTGVTDENGMFTLSTGAKEGAAEGEYVVTLVWSKEVDLKGKKKFSTAPPETRDHFDGAYADVNKPKIKVEIKRGPNKLDPFNLK